MLQYADRQQVKMCSHTKTPKTPTFAKMQEMAGAFGITAAKAGEAEVMAIECHKLKFTHLKRQTQNIYWTLVTEGHCKNE